MNWFNHMVAHLLPYVPKPIVGFFSKHYIAGAKLEDAVRVVKTLNANRMMATIDVLGEEVKNKEQSLQAVERYKQVLKTIAAEGLDSNISLKTHPYGIKN